MNKEPRIGDEAWAQLVQDGKQLSTQEDDIRWRLGDLALQVETGYGLDAIGRFADEIGRTKSAMISYRQVARAYEPHTRVYKVSWSHYREVAASESRSRWLEEAIRRNWTVSDLYKQKQRERRIEGFASRKGGDRLNIEPTEDHDGILFKRAAARDDTFRYTWNRLWAAAIKLNQCWSEIAEQDSSLHTLTFGPITQSEIRETRDELVSILDSMIPFAPTGLEDVEDADPPEKRKRMTDEEFEADMQAFSHA